MWTIFDTLRTVFQQGDSRKLGEFLANIPVDDLACNRYQDKFQFRWNTRKMNDGQRVSAAIKQIDGKRLEYRESVENPPYLPQPSRWRHRFEQQPF